jgi:hypothetical protein
MFLHAHQDLLVLIIALLFAGLEGCHDAQNHLIMALFIQYGSLAAED